MSFFSRLSPIPSFPKYRGPHHVGTQEVEIPVSELSSATSSSPDPAITTINFRLFYPSAPAQRAAHSPTWLPDPQTEYFKGYMRFVNAGTFLTNFLSYFPLTRLLFHTVIPAREDQPLLDISASDGHSTGKGSRWPVLIFSHGLGGSKNAYSHICGSLASHGMVVAAIEHRDGSVPVSYMRKTKDKDAAFIKYRTVGDGGIETVATGARDEMVKIRCWELALLHETLMKVDGGESLTDLAETSHLGMFKSKLDLHTPGRTSWAGHSFGAATMVQFLKSVYHRSHTLLAESNISPALSTQITPSSPSIFLDLWALPLTSPQTADLRSASLPCYGQPSDGQRASAPLAILSEGFSKWTENLEATVKTLSASPNDPRATELFPLMFYPRHAAHLSQSDFGILFPWATRRMQKGAEPERIITLNVRAILESLRISGIRVADTTEADLELKPGEAADKQGHDSIILDTREGAVRDWVAIRLDKGGKEAVIGAALEADSGYASADNKEPGHILDVKTQAAG